MYRRKLSRHRVYFKTASGVEITSALATISWLSSNYQGKPVPESDVVNTAVFLVFGNLRNVIQGHYIWTSTTENWLITGVEYRGTVTEFTGLLQSVPLVFTPSSAAGLISEWAFRDGSNITTDEKGLNTLTNINTVAWDSDKPSQSPFTIGSALFASASSEQLRITDASQVQLDITGALTMALRVKFSTVGTFQQLMCKAAADPNLGYEVRLSTSLKIDFACSSDGTGATKTIAIGQTLLSANQWYSICCVQNGTEVIIYLNGVVDIGGSNPKSHSGGQFNNGQNFCLGAYSDSTQFLNGRLFHAFIFNQAKSAADILEWHNTDVWPS